MADVRFIRFLRETNAPSLVKGQKVSKFAAIEASLAAAKEREAALSEKMQELVNHGKSHKDRTESNQHQLAWSTEFKRLQSVCNNVWQEVCESIKLIGEKSEEAVVKEQCLYQTEELIRESVLRSKLQQEQEASVHEIRLAAKNCVEALKVCVSTKLTDKKSKGMVPKTRNPAPGASAAVIGGESKESIARRGASILIAQRRLRTQHEDSAAALEQEIKILLSDVDAVAGCRTPTLVWPVLLS